MEGETDEWMYVWIDGWLGLSEIRVDFNPSLIVMEKIKPVDFISSGKGGCRKKRMDGWMVG